MTPAQYATWKAGMSPGWQDWLSRHPAAEDIFAAFGEQGFEDCWACVSKALPAECTHGDQPCAHLADSGAER